MPLFLLAGGEIVLLLLSLRMARWLWRGWCAFLLERLAARAPEPPEDDPPPGLPLEVLRGGRAAPRAPARGEPEAPALREAA